MVPVPDRKLTINEIFFSIQGESYLAGLPCVFVRLTGCHQRCVYCDTEYAFYEGRKMTIGAVLDEATKYAAKNVLITGGEPLLQENCPDLARAFLDRGYRVAVETGGNRDVSKLPREAVKIMDLKTPASGECERNRYENLRWLDAKDEIKFVIMNGADADWALARTRELKLHELCHVSVSPTDRGLLPLLADRILTSGLPVRLQTQFHKIVWPEKQKGY
jgi:7-carboxy-7-deazaguanine synthase